MRTALTIRSALTALGIFGAIFLSPIFTALCVVLLSMRYRAPEALFIGLLLDFLWMPSGLPYSAIPLCTLTAAAIVWGLEPVRVKLIASN